MKFLSFTGKVLFTAFMMAVVILILWGSYGCSSTVIQTEASKATAIAYDGNDQNAGLLKSDAAGAVFTEKKIAEYRELVKTYGRGTDAYKVLPPVKSDDGVVRKTGSEEGFPEHEYVYRMDNEHLTWFIAFSKWRRMGRTPAD